MKRNEPVTIINHGEPVRAWVHEDRGAESEQIVVKFHIEFRGSTRTETVPLFTREEGTTWCRGYSEEIGKALRAAYNLSDHNDGRKFDIVDSINGLLHRPVQ